jgi:hypothetical protein
MFRNNKEYITLLVYKNQGKRVYYPFDPPPYLDGVRINSPHYLTKARVFLKNLSSRHFLTASKCYGIVLTTKFYENTSADGAATRRKCKKIHRCCEPGRIFIFEIVPNYWIGIRNYFYGSGSESFL